ncbi:uncharacterized protein LOC112905039 isoform X2 [Agrilus planipennis]|uniref:Uncharacterized protein LOC108732826 isoform X2 n=1 Tax=Agrilus planipennis TaxID=224129 RepID=A0A7F5R8V2_AGRPL|nr:uncharacterized protein LOC108732826 isoform X2 [Agrilus planipennis]XP_025832397.1 uncharacterized protein LOC112905039 isoform X2 [Agrilus planipennis]
MPICQMFPTLGGMQSLKNSLLMKAMEVTSSKRPVMSWVAEVYEPYFNANSPEKCSYKIIDENRLMYENFEVKKYRRRIIGTVAVSRHIQDEDVAWLFKLAVESRYRRKGIGHCLIQVVQNWSRRNHYNSIQLAISECQEYARQLFTDCQFDVKQLYHKPIFGNALALQMYHLEAKLDKPNI